MNKLFLLLFIPLLELSENKPPVERYFFVGYIINNGTVTITGNCQWFTNDGLVPVKRELYTFLKKESKQEFTFDELVIVGLSEFKNKKECDFFFEAQKIKQ